MPHTSDYFNSLRMCYAPQLPRALNDGVNLITVAAPTAIDLTAKTEIYAHFPHTAHQPLLQFAVSSQSPQAPLRIGVLFSGGQAAGGHNVIAGLFDMLKKVHTDSKLYGFLNGPGGLVSNRYNSISGEQLTHYRNQGGFDLLGSGRTKIETAEQFKAAAATAKALQLNGIVIIGGDDSNTNAAFLAEYFAENSINTSVVGVPKTIDGDLQNQWVEMPFGFDSAAKTFAALIGNIQRDALSAKKYYHFIKLMGRTASHITLECALQTHANYTLIGEEIAEKGESLGDVVRGIADLIVERHRRGKEYGVILIPEGILEFMTDMQKLIGELNAALAAPSLQSPAPLGNGELSTLSNLLSASAQQSLASLPPVIQQQLLLERDSHGNVPVSKIATDELILMMVTSELKRRHRAGSYEGSFSGQNHFLGYEGRACYPSNFDSQYCYALGYIAGSLINNGQSGYMAAVSNLSAPVAEWYPVAVPLAPLLTTEQRSGKSKIVIAKTIVDLQGAPFKAFDAQRRQWAAEDDYRYPLPIQYYGPTELTDQITHTLALRAAELINIAT